MPDGQQGSRNTISFACRVVAGVFSVLMVAFLGWCTFLARPGQAVDERWLKLFLICLVIALLTCFSFVVRDRNVHTAVKATFVGLIAGIGAMIGCSISWGLIEYFVVGDRAANVLRREILLHAIPLGAALGAALGALIGIALRTWWTAIVAVSRAAAESPQVTAPSAGCSLRPVVAVILCLGMGLLLFQANILQMVASEKLINQGAELVFENEGKAPTWYASLLGEAYDNGRYGAVVEIRFPEGATDEQLLPLRHLPKLRIVDLRGTKITDAGMAHLASLHKLRSLNLAQTRISDAGLAHLCEAYELADLELSNTDVTGQGLAALKSMPQLKTLKLRQSRVTDEGLSCLPPLPSLDFLDLAGTQIQGHGFAQLSGLPRLRMLDLDEAPITDAGLKHIARLTTLRILRLQDTAMSDAGLEHLAKLPRLSDLLLNRTVTPAGVKELQKALPRTAVWGQWRAIDGVR